MLPDVKNHENPERRVDVGVVLLYLHYYWSIGLPAER